MRLAALRAQVERDRALVASEDRPPQRVAVVAQAAPVAHRVAVRRRLHLDHVGAEVAQQRADVGAGEQLAELDHPQALQRAVGERLRRRAAPSGHLHEELARAEDVHPHDGLREGRPARPTAPPPAPGGRTATARAARRRGPEGGAERARDPGHRAHGGEQARAGGGLDDRRWNSSLNAIWSATAARRAAALLRAAHSSSQALERAPLDAGGRARRRMGLDQRADLVEVERVGGVERAHERAAVGLHLDQALALEHEQGLADRRARGAEARRQRPGPQALAGREHALEDRVAQLVSDAAGAGAQAGRVRHGCIQFQGPEAISTRTRHRLHAILASGAVFTGPAPGRGRPRTARGAHRPPAASRGPGSTVSAPTTTVIASSTVWVEPRPSTSGPSSQIEATRDRRDRQPDARHGGAEREVEARLHAVAPRVAHRRERLGQQHEQRDHDADGRLRRADGVDGVLDRRRLDLGQPDDRDERDDQQAEADQRLRGRTAARRARPGRRRRADRQEVVAVAHRLHEDEQPVERERGDGRERELRRARTRARAGWW